jgi:hypothetical protein
MDKELREIIILVRTIYPGEGLIVGAQKLIALGVLPPDAVQKVEAAIKSGLTDWWGSNVPYQPGAAMKKDEIKMKLKGTGANRITRYL